MDVDDYLPLKKNIEYLYGSGKHKWNNDIPNEENEIKNGEVGE